MVIVSQFILQLTITPFVMIGSWQVSAFTRRKILCALAIFNAFIQLGNEFNSNQSLASDLSNSKRISEKHVKFPLFKFTLQQTLSTMMFSSPRTISKLKFVKIIFLFIVFMTASIRVVAQNSFRPGISIGTNFSYPDRSTELSDGFFTIYRSGLQGGLSGLFTINDHFVVKTSLLYVTQSVGLRGEDANFKTDVRVNSDNLLLPIQVGYQNKLGTLILRELIGVSFAQNISRKNNVNIDPGTSNGITADHRIDEIYSRSFLPMLNVGLEIGSIFNSDAGFFMGIHYRQGIGRFYQFNYSGNYIPNTQFLSTKSNFLSIELTYYFSRPSYWFKKEFDF